MLNEITFKANSNCNYKNAKSNKFKLYTAN